MKLPPFEVLPKAIAVDLDGTLLDSRKEISARNRRALRRCTGTGIAVIIATSRPARWMDRLFEREELETFSFISVANPQ